MEADWANTAHLTTDTETLIDTSWMYLYRGICLVQHTYDGNKQDEKPNPQLAGIIKQRFMHFLMKCTVGRQYFVIWSKVRKYTNDKLAFQMFFFLFVMCLQRKGISNNLYQLRDRKYFRGKDYREFQQSLKHHSLTCEFDGNKLRFYVEWLYTMLSVGRVMRLNWLVNQQKDMSVSIIFKSRRRVVGASIILSRYALIGRYTDGPRTISLTLPLCCVLSCAVAGGRSLVYSLCFYFLIGQMTTEISPMGEGLSFYLTFLIR